MKTVIMAQTNYGVREYILPQIHNADYQVKLEKDIFGLQKDIELKLEVIDEQWQILEDEAYDISGITEAEGNLLRDGGLFYLYTHEGKVQISLLIVLWADCKVECQKFDLSGMTEISIGNVEGNQICYQYKGFISKRHALLVRTQNEWTVYDYSTNGTFINGKRVEKSRKLVFGDCIMLFGLRLIFLGNVLACMTAGGALKFENDCMRKLVIKEPEGEKLRGKSKKENHYYKSAPRIVEPLFDEVIEIEGPPTKKQEKKKPLFLTIGPAFTMAIPMLLGCMMSVLGAKSRGGSGGAFMFTGMITALSSAVFGVIWALTNMKYTAKTEHEDEELRYNAYGQYLLDVAEKVREKYEYNMQVLHKTYMSGQACTQIRADSGNLWNRNSTQNDMLWVRLGRGNIPFPAQVEVPKPRFALLKDDLMEKPEQLKRNFETMTQVPIGINMLEHQLIGVIGGENKEGGYGIIRNIVAQIAANNSYADVKMVFIYDGTKGNQQENWNFVKWFPHVWSEDKKTRFVAENKTDVGDICYVLGSMFRGREEVDAYSVPKNEMVKPYYIFFLINPEMLEGELIYRYVTHPDKRYGCTTFWLTECYEQLPNSCEEIIQNDAYGTGFFNICEGMSGFKKVAFEYVYKDVLEQQARALAGVEVECAQRGGDIPNQLEFLEMYGIGRVEDLKVYQRWKKSKIFESMRVPIGKRAGGQDCFLDIHEKYHGPHGLMAGTTGSGKSETLQTYILSLAVNFGPDDVNFFLIDFKGGGMANLFTNLPHLAGKISNLSGNQVKRAMVSIKSENRWRQKIFSENSVNNINSYTRLYKNGEATIPVPHLLIVIDEFAELKREEPEFMRELISVAQVGRSLGVHLILATQKPDGTVDENIWSNSKFRLCLRVQDKKDSSGMLHRPDAAYITQVGRGYLQVGNDEIFEMFQSAYSGAVYDDSQELGGTMAEMISLTGRKVLEGRKNSRKNLKADNGQTKNQLEAVIAYVAEVAKENGYAVPRQLWMPVLPEYLYLFDLQESTRWDKNRKYDKGNYHLQAAVGKYDDPANQAQGTLKVDFAKNGHHAVCGGVVTGKSTFLQTVIFSLLNAYTPLQMQCYLLDFGSKMLNCFEQAPHVGGIVNDGEPDRLKIFFSMLERMMDERKKLLKGGNFEQYIRANGEVLPAVLIVIDNYAGMKEKSKDQYAEIVLRLVKEGVGYGIYLLVSSAGFGMAEIPTRIGDSIKTTISLEMGDKTKYSEVLRVMHIETLPESGVKGRGLARVNGELLEFQTALALQADDDFARGNELEKYCLQMKQDWQLPSAVRIPEIPKNPEYSMYMEKSEVQRCLTEPRYLPIGYRELDASIYSIDLARTYSYLISGKSGSGKTNLLKAMLLTASLKNAELVVIDLKGNEMELIAQNCNARYVKTHEELFAYFKELFPEFVKRNKCKQKYLAEGFEGEALYEKMQKEKAVYIFVSDMDSFVGAVYKKLPDGAGMEAFVENVAEKGMMHNIYFIGCVKSEEESLLMAKKVFKCFAENGTGIHLGGNLSAQRVFQFSNLNMTQQSKPLKPGIGFVPSEEDISKAVSVILPVVRGNKR